MVITLAIMGIIMVLFFAMLGWLAHDIDECKKVMQIIWDYLSEEEK